MSYTSNDNGFLHIGDIITLYGNADHSGYIYTMGIIDDRMFIRKNDDVGNEEDLSSDRFRDCLFRICNCYKYNAQKQYWHALQQRKEACQYRPHLEMPMDDWSHRTHKYTDRFIRKLKFRYSISFIMSLNFNVIESTPDYMNNESSSSTFTATPNQLSMSPIFDVNDEFRCLTRSSNKCGTSIQSSLTTNGKIHLNSNSNILKSGYVEQQNNNHSVFNFDMSITNSKSSIESKISDLYLTSLTDKSDLSNDSHTTKNHHIIGAYDQSPDSEPEFKLADLNDDTSLIEVCSQNKFPGCLESDQPFRLAHRQTQMSCESFTVCSPPANQVTIESTNQMNRVGDEVSLKEFETNHSFNSVTEFYGSPQTCVLPSSFPSSSGDSEFIKDKNLSNSKECQAILSLKRDMDQLSDSSDNESISGKTGAVYVLEVCGTLPVLCDLLRDRRIHFTADRCHDNVRRVIATPQFKTISTQTSD